MLGIPGDVSGTIAEFQKDIKAIRVLLEQLLELERKREAPVATYSTQLCPGGCDCSCCYGYPNRDCHCFTYPCNCGGGPVEHGQKP